MSVAWTPERTKDLMKMWETSKMTAEEIANDLGTTKSAVLGKARRMKLTYRGVPAKPASERRKPTNFDMPHAKNAKLKSAYEAATDVVLDDPIIPPEQRKTLLDLEADDCRYPYSSTEEGGIHFCGRERVAGRPYCASHLARCVVPLRSGGSL